jgi:hypothetical protein
MQLKTHFSVVPDHRRPQGRMYDLGHLLLFSVLAVVSGATSYRKIQRFMDTLSSPAVITNAVAL